MLVTAALVIHASVTDGDDSSGMNGNPLIFMVLLFFHSCSLNCLFYSNLVILLSS